MQEADQVHGMDIMPQVLMYQGSNNVTTCVNWLQSNYMVVKILWNQLQ